MNIILRLAFAVGAFAPTFLQAQSRTPDETSVKNDSAFVEAFGIGASHTDWTPFWLQANQWGTIPKSGNGGGLRIGWAGTRHLGSEPAGWRLTGGVEALETITNEAKFLLPEAYGGIRKGNLELWAGRKKQQVGLGDSTLGMGAYAMSGNAMPPLKVQIGVYEYTGVPFTNNWLQFMGFYSDGLMDRNREVTSNLRLHQKQLYLRAGNPAGWLRLYAGMNHQAQWGGQSPYFRNDEDLTDKQMPKKYLDVVFGIKGGAGQDLHDSTNRIGNHLGSVDLGMEIKTYEADFFFYRQSIYEDGSFAYLRNIADGLNGVRIRKNTVYGAPFEIHEGVFEFLYTKHQGGSAFSATDPRLGGRSNYFNNYQVRDGWSYLQRTIGTPFITPGSDTRHLGQRYVYGDSFTNNNRVWVAHVGLKGAIFNALTWTTKISYSRNFGVYDLEGRWPAEGLSQWSGMISLKRSTDWLGGLTISGAFGMDYGDLYPVTYGGMLSLRKHLFF